MAEFTQLKLDFTLKELTCRPEDRDVPGASSILELRDDRLVCVEYPAVVTSSNNMLETLGGERAVSKTFANPNRRLELRYRPQDPFCHPLCGNRFSSSNLLLRVRRRVRKKDPKDVQIQMDLLGVIGTTYKFQGMADFQCLAVHSEGGTDMALYDKIILRKSENQEFFEKPVPYFLPPAIFSRLDSPVDYFYRPDIHHNQMPINKKSFIGLNRVRRPNNAIFVSFTDPTVPSECLEGAKLNWARVCLKDSDRESEEQLKMMFESRPIWSRNAVKANINIHPDKLKLLLPLFAYYMVTGPWRSLWVRFGYDPRKNPDSKKYQMLDFRFRCSSKHGYSISDLPVKAKRSALNYSLPITFNKTGPQPASVMDLPAQEGPSSSRDTIPVSYKLRESSFIFRDGMLPPHRQMFYQLCDLDVESLKEVIEQKGDEQVCNERDGWCVLGTTDKLRDMISAMIQKVTWAQKPAVPQVLRRSQRNVSKSSMKGAYAEDDEDEDEGENEDDDDDEFLPSEGSENEMETEILDYM
ncbi:general transcription factor 3C polypeptide 5 [Paralichthys olivaceus]|uniref:general transcription factor 3C polypeptide 5 n=1 Tax=Paralichthys olivaceus TaxID=8255 RepID=UPI00097D3162|nr:PREDICTED: general transcription factor 3C polypeptide 5 [Paralichthys olivaceus]